MSFHRTLVPVCAMGVVLQRDKIKNNIVVMNASLSVIFIILMITNIVNNAVVTEILVNRNMVVYICITAILVSGLLLYGSCSMKQNLCITFNIVFSIVHCITSGSRMGTYVSIISIAGIALIIFRKKLLYYMRYALYTLSAALIISIMVYTHICDAHFWVLRGFNVSTVATSISVENNTEISSSAENDAGSSNSLDRKYAKYCRVYVTKE